MFTQKLSFRLLLAAMAAGAAAEEPAYRWSSPEAPPAAHVSKLRAASSAPLLSKLADANWMENSDSRNST